MASELDTIFFFISSLKLKKKDGSGNLKTGKAEEMAFGPQRLDFVERGKGLEEM